MKKINTNAPLPDGVEEPLRLPQMMKATGLKTTQIYELIKQGLIPRPVKLGKRAVGWYRSEVIAYQNRLREQRYG